MAEHQIKELKLQGGLPRTASFVRIAEDGSLTFELYDYSDFAESSLGGDVAFLLKVTPSDALRVFAYLTEGQDAKFDPALLLQIISRRFGDYYAVKQWLEARQIPYEKDFDSWA